MNDTPELHNTNKCPTLGLHYNVILFADRSETCDLFFEKNAIFCADWCMYLSEYSTVERSAQST